MHGGAAPQVKRKAAERLADLIDPDRALRQAARIAYADIRECYDENGKLLPTKDWPDTVAAAVSAIKTTTYNEGSGDGVQERVVELKRWDSVKALDMLFRHLALYKDKLELTGQVDLVQQRLHEGRKRVARG